MSLSVTAIVRSDVAITATSAHHAHHGHDNRCVAPCFAIVPVMREERAGSNENAVAERARSAPELK
jgi:hypothetical protein